MIKIITLILMALAFTYSNEIQRFLKILAHEEVPLTTTLFDSAISQGELELTEINEASGLVASRSLPQAFWTHNDSGGENKIFLINKSGENLGAFILEGAVARDWEDISIGPGPEANATYLYVGDIGDNKARHHEKTIYRFIEPDVSNLNTAKKVNIPKQSIETIRFKFPDGKRDAETLMVDPVNRDIYVISKREANVGVYVARYPQSTTQLNTLTKVASLNLHEIVAGDISFQGNEVLLKDYNNVYHWQKNANESIENLLKTPPQRLPYKPEPQGEAIAWALDGSGFYTLSEEAGLSEAMMYFYARK